MAKFEWDGSKFSLKEKYNLKTNDLKKIKTAVDDNADLIIRRWNEYFN